MLIRFTVRAFRYVLLLFVHDSYQSVKEALGFDCIGSCPLSVVIYRM